FPAAAPGRTWRRAARGLCRESPVFRRQALLMPVLRPVWSPWKWGGLFTMSRVRRETRRRRRRTAVALGLVVAVVGLTGMARPKDGFDRRSRSLEAALRAAVQAQHFERVVDFGPVEGACPGAAWCPSPAATIAHMPNIDLAVIALDRRGRPRAVADVLFSRDYPHGAGVPVGDDLGTDDVRWRRWNPDRWNGGTFSETDGSRQSTVGWKDNPPLTADDDIVPGRDKAPLEFM